MTISIGTERHLPCHVAGIVIHGYLASMPHKMLNHVPCTKQIASSGPDNLQIHSNIFQYYYLEAHRQL